MKGYLINLAGKRISGIAKSNKDIGKLRKKVIVKGKRIHSNILVIEV